MTEPADRLFDMLSGFRVSQLIRTAVLLGICDALANAPRVAPDVAAEVSVDPGVLRRLMRALAAHGVLDEGPDGRFDRCDLVIGSFFDSLPGRGDAYLLKFILHDWDDERAAAILATCRRAMRPGARLLVIDAVLPERAGDTAGERLARVYDLHMHVLFGARERTEDELRRMLTSTGFAVERVVPTSPPSTVVATAV